MEMKLRSLVRKHFPRPAGPELGYDPYDVDALHRRAETFAAHAAEIARLEPQERCRRVLSWIQQSYPTQELSQIYFSSLEAALADKEPIESGVILIGIGPGRCGSTSLSHMLGSVRNSCCTHEGPPLIFWTPTAAQIDFHVRRLRLLATRFALVSDVCHWWLNALPKIWEAAPQVKVVGLIREAQECATSFMRIQGFGAGSSNPWAPRGNGFWSVGAWDATYPSFPIPDLTRHDPDRVKLDLITRYVSEYNDRAEQLAQAHPDSVKIVRTEALSAPETQAEIFALAGSPGQAAKWKMNVRGTGDGVVNQIRL